LADGNTDQGVDSDTILLGECANSNESSGNKRSEDLHGWGVGRDFAKGRGLCKRMWKEQVQESPNPAAFAELLPRF
jgi:hypothetical protein